MFRILLGSITCVVILVHSAPDLRAGLGVYANAAGTQDRFQPISGEMFDIHVVLFEETTANAVAYTLDLPGLGVDLFQDAASYGPSGAGEDLPSGGGSNVDLGECASGVGGSAILVATYTLHMTKPGSPRTFSIGPNTDEDPTLPVISSCEGRSLMTPIGSSLEIGALVEVESMSWGAVRALY